MAENALIDIISYKPTPVETTGVARLNGENSFDQSSDFSNILDTANKTYSSKEESSFSVVKNTEKAENSNNTNATQNIQKEEKSDNTAKSNNESTTQKNSENSSEKVSKNSSENDSSNQQETKTTTNAENKESTVTENNEQKADTETNNIQKTTENTSQTETLQPNVQTAANNEIEALISNIKTEKQQDNNKNVNITTSEENTKTNSNKTEKSEQTKENNLDTKVDNKESIELNVEYNPASLINPNQKDPTSKESTGEMINTADITQTKVSVIAENIIGGLAINPSETDTKNNLQTQNTNQVNIADQNTVIQPDFSIDLANLTKTSNEKSEIPVQQLQPDIKIAQQDTTLPSAENISKVKNVDTQSPLIEVSDNKILADANIKNDNTLAQNVKEVLDKTSLTQEALDKVNAKVVSVENSETKKPDSLAVNVNNSNSSGTNSSNLNTNLDSNNNANSNNSKNKQNTQDQVVKLALEGTINTTNTSDLTASDLSAIKPDSTIQTSFEKTLNTVQTPSQTYQTKEINDTEIISQINNKLSTLKNEGTTTVNIILKPENLGKINLELVTSKEGLTAQLTTNNSQVKEILDKTLNDLKDNLANQGINVNNVTVKVDETQKQSNNDMFEFEDQTKQGYQQQSGSQKDSDENKFSFGEEIDNIMSNTIKNATSDTENLVSVGSHAGNIDYKI